MSRKRPQEESTPLDGKVESFLYRLSKVRDIDRDDVDVLQQTFRGIQKQIYDLSRQLSESNTRIAQLQAEAAQSGSHATSTIAELQQQLLFACDTAIWLYKNQVDYANEQICKKVVSLFMQEISIMSSIKTMVINYSVGSPDQATELVHKVLLAIVHYDVLFIVNKQYRNVLKAENLVFEILKKLRSVFPENASQLATQFQKMEALRQRYSKDADILLRDLAQALGQRFDTFLNRIIGFLREQPNSLPDIMAFINFTLEARLSPVNRVQNEEASQSSDVFVYSLEEGYFYALLFRYVAIKKEPSIDRKLHLLSDIVWQFLFNESGAIRNLRDLPDLNTLKEYVMQGLQTVYNNRDSGLQTFMKVLGDTLCQPAYTQAKIRIAVHFDVLRNSDGTPITEKQVLDQWIGLIVQLQDSLAKSQQQAVSDRTTTFGDVCSLIKCVLRPGYVKNTEMTDEQERITLQQKLDAAHRNIRELQNSSALQQQGIESQALQEQTSMLQRRTSTLEKQMSMFQQLIKQCHLSNWHVLRQIAFNLKEGEVINDLTTFRKKYSVVIKILKEAIENAVTVYNFTINPANFDSLSATNKEGWKNVINKMNEYKDWFEMEKTVKNWVEKHGAKTLIDETIKGFFFRTVGTLLQIDLITEHSGIPSLDPSSAQLSLKYIVQQALRVATKVNLTISATKEISYYTLPDIGADDLDDLNQDDSQEVDMGRVEVLKTNNTLKQIMAAQLGQTLESDEES